MKRASPTINLAGIIEGWAAQFPSKTAMHFQGTDTSYAQLWNSIEGKTRALQVSRGDRVAWLGYNHPEMLVLLFALARLGAILVPLNWRLAAAEHQQILEDCTPKWISSTEFEPRTGLGIPLGKPTKPSIRRH
jgi:fatty-acyl-CoA synthase